MGYRDAKFEGRSGAKPELRKTQTGTSFTSISLAVSEKRAETFETHWFKINAWGSLADRVVEMVDKGTPLIVFAKPTVRKWTDKNGANVERVEFEAYRIYCVEQLKRNSEIQQGVEEYEGSSIGF